MATVHELVGRRPAWLRGPLLAPGATAAAAVAAAVVLHTVDPNDAGNYPTCPFLALTGLHCPGCGTLRAIHALTYGHLGAAVGLNVLTVAAVPFAVVMWARWAAGRARGRPTASFLHPSWPMAFGVLLVVFAVVRNLPFGSALAP